MSDTAINPSVFYLADCVYADEPSELIGLFSSYEKARECAGHFILARIGGTYTPPPWSPTRTFEHLLDEIVAISELPLDRIMGHP